MDIGGIIGLVVAPRFDNVSRVGRARNRRVEIVILDRRAPAQQP